MIVEERGIPVWTRVRLPPGPFQFCKKSARKLFWLIFVFGNFLHFYRRKEGNKYMYRYKNRVSYSQLDRGGTLGVTHVLDVMQDACMFHCQEVGRSCMDLKKEGKAWLVSSWHLIIHHLPDAAGTAGSPLRSPCAPEAGRSGSGRSSDRWRHQPCPRPGRERPPTRRPGSRKRSP